MGKQVFANGMEIAHKSGVGQVIAAFPDVCLSPPPPPAGPVPIPYPNTSFAKDLKDGTSSVKIGGKPLALKGQSFYKSSPLGNEAATRNFGAAVITHTITGKTYFQASSMDVQAEGKPVCRHLDITTSNHASEPGSTPPMPNTESMAANGGKQEDPKCECCGGPVHGSAASRPAMTTEQFYNPKGPSVSLKKKDVQNIEWANALLADAKQSGCGGVVMHSEDSDPCAKHYPATAEENRKARDEYDAMMSPNTEPSYFVQKYGPKLGAEVQARGQRLRAAKAAGAVSIAHKTPLSAGGCPVGEGNLAPVKPDCAFHETELGKVQGSIAEVHRRAHGLI